MIKKRLNIGKVYFIYLFSAIFLQILGINSKGGLFDTLWKSVVISLTLIFLFVKSQMKIKKYICIPLIVYFFGQCIAIISNEYSSISSLVNCMIIIGMSYMFLSVPYYNKYFKLDDIFYFINAFIILMLYAVLYNFIKNPSSVLNVLSNSNVYSNMMSSFFDNKQTFGMFLFMAFIVSMWGYTLKNKKYYIFTAIIFFVNLFLCLSRTALFACIVFIIMFAFSIRKVNQKLFKILIFLIFLSIIIVQINPLLNEFINNVMLDTNATMNARTNIWEDAFNALQNIRFFWGYGEGNATSAIAIVNKGANAHNGIVYVLLTGGVIKLILYFLVLFKSYHSISIIKKYNPSISSMYLCALVSIIIYSMGEALVLLDSSAPCIVASIICLAFPIATEGFFIFKNTN